MTDTSEPTGEDLRAQCFSCGRRPPAWRRLLAWGGAAAVGAWSLVVFAFWNWQEAMIYLPPPPSIARLPAGFIPERIPLPDGRWVQAARAPAQRGMPTILMFGGQGAAIADTAAWALPIVRRGWGIAVVSYRGYEGSPGAPDEAGIEADLPAVGAWISQRSATAPIVLGHSFGSGPATAFAGRFHTAGLILAGAFDSVAAVARERYPLLPISLISRNDWDNAARAHDVPPATHVEILHGSADDIIAPAHAEALVDAFGGRAEFQLLPGVGHIPPAEAVLAAAEHLALFRQRSDTRPDNAPPLWAGAHKTQWRGEPG